MTEDEVKKNMRSIEDYVRRTYPDLYKQLISQEISFKEALYIHLHGEDKCTNGNEKKFKNLTIGYTYCSRTCACKRADHSEAMKNKWDSRTEEERSSIIGKWVDAVNAPEVKEKVKKTNRERYGGDSPWSSKEIWNKTRETLVENHGVTAPGLSPIIMDKVKKTNQERYSETHTMGLAREAFRVSNNGLNPFQLEEVKRKIRATLLERYGVDHPLKSSVIRGAMVLNSMDRWGTPWPLQSNEIKQKIFETNNARYNRNHAIQAQLSDEAYQVLNDEEQFREIIAETSLRDFSKRYECGYDTVRKYCLKYGIQLPTSSYQRAIVAELRDMGVENIRLNDRTIIKPLELDIVLPDYKVAIEFNGLYWHSEEHRDRNYHLNKVELGNQAGYRVISLFEDEWVNNSKIVLSRLRNILGLSEKGASARDLVVREIDHLTTEAFLNVHHSQGSGSPASIRYGAFDDDTLAAVMTFVEPRISTGRVGGYPELLRFCTDGKTHVGISSKMLKAFIRDYKPAGILSYADRRWSEGGMYESMGFKLVKKTNPNYWYYKLNGDLKREHRFKFRKTVLVEKYGADPALTEVENMKNMGYTRIWDCGSLVYELVINE